MAVARVEDLSRYGAVTVDETGAITAFGEKGRSGPGLINAGAYLIETSVLDDIPPGRAVSLEREVFPTLIGKGLYGMIIDGPFLDIGTEETYRQAEAFLARWSKEVGDR
jgi:NDP-sugar pyrophosphorylase family protein